MPLIVILGTRNEIMSHSSYAQILSERDSNVPWCWIPRAFVGLQAPPLCFTGSFLNADHLLSINLLRPRAEHKQHYALLTQFLFNGFTTHGSVKFKADKYPHIFIAPISISGSDARL